MEKEELLKKLEKKRAKLEEQLEELELITEAFQE